jgi:hypothetical protein
MLVVQRRLVQLRAGHALTRGLRQRSPASAPPASDARGCVRVMCHKCFEGLTCLDDAKALQTFIDGFSKPRVRKPLIVVPKALNPVPVVEQKAGGPSGDNQQASGAAAALQAPQQAPAVAAAQ